MVSALVIDPFNSDRLMYGTGATIYGTNNLTNWDAGQPINISVMVQGLEETAVLDIISPPTGAHLLSALADITGFRHDDLSLAPARMYDNPRDTPVNLDYAERRSNFIVRVGNGNANHIAFSFDGGSTWTPASAQPPGTNGGGTVAAGADASHVVWSPSGAEVSFSTNNGASWTASVGIPRGATVISDRVNPLKFYGFANGVFYVSVNGGANFTASTATGLPGFARFKAVPGRGGDIWLAGGGSGLWRSVDGGATFTRLSDVEVADCIGFGKAAPPGRPGRSGRGYPAIYALAQVDGVQGIFRSDDAGASWIRINDDQHQFATAGATITGDSRIYGRVYIGTNGRGIIQGDNHGPR